MNFSEEIAKKLWSLKAVEVNPKKPRRWVSGYTMPMYLDARKLLGNYEGRTIAENGLVQLPVDFERFDLIAGVANGGVPWATFLADYYKKPLGYISKPKAHGFEGEIYGIAPEDVEGKRILLVDDSVSFGTSSIRAIKALEKLGGICNEGVSVYNYGFKEAIKNFMKEVPKFSAFSSILYYETLICVATKEGRLNQTQLDALAEWRTDPFNWGEKHGFSKEQK